MATLYGDTGRVTIGTLKEFTIDVKPAVENNATLDPTNPIFTTSLPTSTDTPHAIDLTLTEGMLPVITPKVPTKYTVGIIVGGQNPTAGSIQVNQRGFVNGVERGSSYQSTVAISSRYWMATIWKYFDVVPNDILRVELWANLAGATCDYFAYVVYPTQIEFTKAGNIITDLSLQSWATYNLTANQSGSTLTSPNAQFNNIYFNSQVNSSTSANTTIPAINNSFPYFYRTTVGDASTNTITNYTHGSFRYYQSLGTWRKVSFRELSR